MRCALRVHQLDLVRTIRRTGSSACVVMVVKVRRTDRLRFAEWMSVLCDVFHRTETLSVKRT